MPKISYLDKDKALFDDTETTQAQIEAKIAEIEELLRGRMDEDNLLSYQNDTDPIPIPPSIVKDLPGETRPVNNSMKFFGNTTDHPDSIIDSLFLKTTKLQEINPKFFNLNDLGDLEILIVTEIDKDESQRKVINIEVPINYSPLTWRELWEYISEVNLQIAVQYNGDVNDEGKYTIANAPLFSLSGFLSEFGANADDYVYETMYNLQEAHSVEQYAEYDSKNNNIIVTAQVYPNDTSEENIYRFIPTFLCRVNP